MPNLNLLSRFATIAMMLGLTSIGVGSLLDLQWLITAGIAETIIGVWGFLLHAIIHVFLLSYKVNKQLRREDDE